MGLARQDGARWSWVREFIRPERRALAGILTLSSLATGLALVPPYLTKWLVDLALLPGDARLLLWLCAALFAVTVGGAVLAIANQYLHTRVSGRVLFAMREQVFAHLLLISPRRLAAEREGQLFARLDGDVAEVQRFGLDSLLALFSGTLGLIATVTLLIALAPRLALVTLAIIPLEFFALRWLRPRIATRTRALRERTGELTTFFVDALPAIKQIQSLGIEAREGQHLKRLHRGYLGDLLSLQLWNGAAGNAPRLIGAAGQTLVFAIGGSAVIAGSLSLGSLLAFAAYLARSIGPVQTLLGVYTSAARAGVSLDRVRELTALRPEVTSPANPHPLPGPPVGTGAIRFSQVSFGHEGEEAIFGSASCDIAAGTKVLLSGPSGIGKSTWIDLLLRHYDPDAGNIFLDGVDLRHLELSALRRAVAVVGQGGVLFSGTIAENLRYGAPEDTSDSTLREAAERAQLREVLAQRQLGLETRVGPRAQALSGGERQRLLLARAFLRDPRVLILDEATSELDPASEASIDHVVDTLFPASTRIVVRHRSRDITPFDLCLEIEGQGLHVRRSA